MTNQEAREELADLADSLNLIPSTRKGHAMQMALDALKERKTGRWENIHAEMGYKGDGWIGFTCENCKCQHAFGSGEYGWYYGEEIPWKYCPNCGAKMEVEDERKRSN